MSWQSAALVAADGTPAQPSQYGITKVISFKGPTEADIAASAALEGVLRDRHMYESSEEIAARQVAVAALIELVQAWMREEGIALGMIDPESAGDAAWAHNPGMVCMFGSFRLGVHGPGADMDTLVVGPHYITRQAFFEKFTKRLAERTDIVTEISARLDAYVPLITMKILGIEFDLLYAQMSAALGLGRPDAGVTDGALLFNIYDDMCLRGLDPKSVLSLNGARVTDMIRMLMPPESEESFCTALIFIRLWARKRAVYSNVHGYLGGISWALLVAQVCQLYPNASPSTLIAKFFALYQQWRWPYPILLNEVKHIPELASHMPVWDPKNNFKDRQDLMPIITPAFPAMNSTHNVSKATLKVLQAEFTRGHQLFEKAALVKPPSPTWIWDELLSPSTFFYDFPDFLDIKVSSRREEDQLMWLGYVESKVRQLVLPLTKFPHLRVAPFPKPFTEQGATYIKQVRVPTLEEKAAAEAETAAAMAAAAEAGEEFVPPPAAAAAAAYPPDAAPGSVITTAERLWVDHFFIGLEFDLVELKKAQAAASTSSYASTTDGSSSAAGGAAPVQMNLSDPVNQFRSIVFDYFSIKDPERSARGFNCDVANVKSRALPEFVFEGRAERPEGWGKKKGGKKRKDTAQAQAATATATTTTTGTAPTATNNTPNATAETAAVAAADTPVDSSSTAAAAPDSKRVKTEGEPLSAETKSAPELPADQPMTLASSSSDDALPKLESVAETASAAAAATTKGEGEGKDTTTAMDTDTQAVKTEGEADTGRSHHVHEMELALPEEPVIVGKLESDSTAAAPGTDANAAAAESAATPAAPTIIVAAEAVPTITQSSSTFEVKKRAPVVRAPMFKITAAPKPAAPTTAPAVPVNAQATPAASASGTPAATTATAAASSAAGAVAPSPVAAPPASSVAAPLSSPISAASSCPSLKARPSPATSSPPLMPTPSPAKPLPSPSAAAAAASANSNTIPSTPPVMLRPGSLRSGQKPSASKASGAGRIQTSDDLEDGGAHSHARTQQHLQPIPMQSLTQTTQQAPTQQQQQQPSKQPVQQQQQQQQSTSSTPLLPMPSDQPGQQQQQQQQPSPANAQQQQQQPHATRGGRGRGGRNNVGVVNAGMGNMQQQQQQQHMAQLAYQQQLLMQQQMMLQMNPLAYQQQMMMMQQQQQHMMMMQQQQQQQQQQQRGGGGGF